MVVGFSFISWLIVLVCLNFIKDLPRFWFVALHYALNIIVFGTAFYFYFKNFKGEPFETMAYAMISLIVIEVVFWKFIYRGDLWFLNFVDWILPAFLVASTIYFIGVSTR